MELGTTILSCTVIYVELNNMVVTYH